MKAVWIRPLDYKGERRIRVDFESTESSARDSVDEETVLLLRKIRGARWSQTNSCWHIPYSKEAYARLKEVFKVESIEKPNGGTSQKEFNGKAKPLFKTIKREWGEVQVVVGSKVIAEQINEKWLKVYVPYDKKGWVEFIKTLPGRRWNVEGKYWALPYVKETIVGLREFLGGDVVFSFGVAEDIPERITLIKRPPVRQSPYDRLNDMQKLAIAALEDQLMLERKSWRTIKTYKSMLVQLFLYYKVVKPSQITCEQLNNYILNRIKVAQISISTQNQLINAINKFYRDVLHQDEKTQMIRRPKKEKKLPNIASGEEIAGLLNAAENLKHKTILMLIYSAGLRKSELLSLRVVDVHFDRKVIFVRNSKGNKDRYTLLSDKVIGYLKEYLKQYKPKYWLFQGNSGGQYSETSVQKIFTRAKVKSNINPYLTVHGLRHSFATHLVEQGVSIHNVQNLLGHGSIKTTEIYLHIAKNVFDKIRSPLDDLDL